MNDFLLILQMKQGNEKAFDKFVRKYYAEILLYCRNHCLDQTEAEDLTQETFLRFIENIASYQHIGIISVLMVPLMYHVYHKTEIK